LIRAYPRACFSTGANEREIYEVLLATSEAYTNAVKHPQKPTNPLVDIEGSITDHALSISIRDYGTWQSEQTRKDGGGIGLALMEHLMNAVRVERFLDGTTVTMHRRLGDPLTTAEKAYVLGGLRVSWVNGVGPPVQLDAREGMSLLHVLVDRVEHLQDAPLALAHIH
jgi:anti-sigma regulatory factor (Ser/Thr protein kinase)